MGTIIVERHDDLAIVKLNRGVTNAINLPLIQEFSETLREARQNGDLRALVISSANDKFFSIGFDIPRLFDSPPDEFQEFYQAFNRLCLELFTFPRPTVAAISGHAVAGGYILALCCDYRYMAEGRKLMGLNEIKLGVPVPYVADCILRQLIGVRNARHVMEMGEFYQSGEALSLGLVDRIITLELVLPEAIAKANSLGALPREAYSIIKRNRVEAVETEIQRRLAEKERLFLELWFSEVARENLKAVIEKF